MASEELRELYEQRKAIESTLELDPTNDEFLSLKADLDELIRQFESEASPATRLSGTTAAPLPPPKPTESAPKWDQSKHPAFVKQAQQARPEEAPNVYRQNDVVLARWSGDRLFYEARITSITGSSADPVYIVRFLKYDEHAQLRRHDLKPISQPSKKRKADDGPVASTTVQSTALAPANPGIITAPSTVDPELAAMAREAKGRDADSRPNKTVRQMPKSKALNNAKTSWQSFQQKGKGKSGKKESMFRTQEGNPNARVGFTGSGHEMRKDVARIRNVYNQQDDEAE